MIPAFTSSFTPLAAPSRGLPTLAPRAAPATPVSAPRFPAPATMKIFDHKRRGQELGVLAESEVISLTTLVRAPGARHRKRRVGRGEGAGQSTTCGFGEGGNKQRSGRPTRPGFEGGQTPLYRRLPKFVGRPMGPGHEYTNYFPLKVDVLNQLEDGQVAEWDAMLAAGVVTKKKRSYLVKIVGGWEDLTTKNLTVKAHAFTTSAVEQIEKMGGKCILISPTTGEDIEMDDDDEEEAPAVAAE
eukprot:CAMPEP_0184731212 /NCGR_PEP_ID=MMETSP0314-20130426/50176_1 /TAXON_ID=38298 /ORGANISM="Rhodella maculata, Strain CCMP 736" /LENGTH=241 /DNA_ID=CAMNT_0027197543 /DNA_START=27 /DNA_END=752 /DNA_ORIENTATION=-